TTDDRRPNTEFLLATEISSIYSQGGQTRRIHNLLWVPTIFSAEKIISELNKRGCNLGSDGRPIVGLTSKEVLEIALSVDETALIIPAHSWTPWFALYGSKSGFNSIEECFEDLSKYIYAVETGLSSDPAMNWRIADLDNRAIVSFSDAHSGQKLGREATVFELEEVSYENIRKAIVSSQLKTDHRKPSTDNHISSTIEFYPEEGKYHWDGHRNCKVRQTPEQTRKRGTQCPVCGRPLTVGVEYRVNEIASRDPITPVVKVDQNGIKWKFHPQKSHPPFVNMVPLVEIISEVRGVGVNSRKVQEEYVHLIEVLGPEFTILLKSDLKEIARTADGKLAEAVQKVRSGDIFVDPGFDGEFGKVKVNNKDEKPLVEEGKKQMELF
ncbi:MAG: endonuclease Q family protein, partial [Candidatus Paceibacterota bacterium]